MTEWERYNRLKYDMIKKTVYFSRPFYLYHRNNQMQIKSKMEEEGLRSISIEDIGLVILDNSQITVSHGLINALIENNAAILWCNDKHMPNGLVLPMFANHVYTEKIRHQLSASQPLKKQLWRQTVQCKINNQASVIESLGYNTKNMDYWALKTASGDPQNMEGRAAAYYWQCVFHSMGLKNTTRERDGAPPNQIFNYGYAILRAIVARSLVASGCLPAVGIHHRNKYNPFCLADDIMEPYRPIIDKYILEWIFDHKENIPHELTQEVKGYLLNIPVIDTNIKGNQSPLMVGMQRTTASLMDCFEGSLKKINYPEI